MGSELTCYLKPPHTHSSSPTTSSPAAISPNFSHSTYLTYTGFSLRRTFSTFQISYRSEPINAIQELFENKAFVDQSVLSLFFLQFLKISTYRFNTRKILYFRNHTSGYSIQFLQIYFTGLYSFRLNQFCHYFII